MTPSESATIVCAGLGVRSMQELTFPAAEGTAAGMISVPNQVWLLVMAICHVARSLCAIRCASGWADLAIRIYRCTARCWRWAAAHAGVWAAFSVLWLSFNCLRMAAALTGDQAVLTFLLRATSLPCTSAAVASDLAAQVPRMRRFQAMPLLWPPARSGSAPLFAFWAAEDPLSTSGHDWIGKPNTHSSCPGDAVTWVRWQIRSLLVLAQTRTDKQTGKDYIY